MAKSRASQRKKAKPANQPRLGIFWLVAGRLLIDSATMSGCEPYGDHMTYPKGHNEVWERWRQIGKVPVESEYEENARGRVMCDLKGKTFTLLADRCILKRKDLVAEIKKELGLPKKTTLGTDPHYRCFTCLHGCETEEE